jgi:hypothetical protein
MLGFAPHSVVSHAKKYRTNAVIIRKTAIEPSKVITSLRKFFHVIVCSFVALYIIATAVVNGRSHSIDFGSVPIFSGDVKVAIIKTVNFVISISNGLCPAQMG